MKKIIILAALTIVYVSCLAQSKGAILKATKLTYIDGKWSTQKIKIPKSSYIKFVDDSVSIYYGKAFKTFVMSSLPIVNEDGSSFEWDCQDESCTDYIFMMKVIYLDKTFIMSFINPSKGEVLEYVTK